jgi:phosphoserine phosphatase
MVRLKGKVHIDEIKKILVTIPLYADIEYVFKELKKMNFYIAIVSAGIDLIANELPYVDTVLANGLKKVQMVI